MLPILLLFLGLGLNFVTANTLKNKDTGMSEQAAISANMLRDQALTKRAPSPQSAPAPAPAQPAPAQPDVLGFITRPNMVVPAGVTMLFAPPPPPPGQDEKRKRSLKKRRDRARPEVYQKKSNSLGGTHLVYDGENVQRSSINKVEAA